MGQEGASVCGKDVIGILFHNFLLHRSPCGVPRGEQGVFFSPGMKTNPRICLCPAALGKSPCSVNCAWAVWLFPCTGKPSSNNGIGRKISYLYINIYMVTRSKQLLHSWEEMQQKFLGDCPSKSVTHTYSQILSTHCCDRSNKVRNQPKNHQSLPVILCWKGPEESCRWISSPKAGVPPARGKEPWHFQCPVINQPALTCLCSAPPSWSIPPGTGLSEASSRLLSKISKSSLLSTTNSSKRD